MNTEPINSINIGFKPVKPINIGFNVGGTSERPPYEGEYEVPNDNGYTLIIGDESLNG